jgi:ubiquinone/menaquinone biosynthesis C-methylase UbiE
MTPSPTPAAESAASRIAQSRRNRFVLVLLLAGWSASGQSQEPVPAAGPSATRGALPLESAPLDDRDLLPDDLRDLLPEPEAQRATEPGRTLPDIPGADPFLNRHYQGADFDQWARVFESPTREVFDQRFQIVHAARPQEGMRIADIGAGTGFFSVLFARAVGPEGTVYAIDTSPEFVTGIEERARVYHVENIVPLVNTQEGIGLPPESIDLAFLSDTYHHLEQPAPMLASIRDALLPYGGLIVVDFHRRAGFSSPWVMGHVRADRDKVIEEIESVGFRLVEAPNILRENFFLRFEKTDDDPSVEVGPVETLEP